MALVMLMLFIVGLAAVGVGGAAWRLGRWMVAGPEGVGGLLVRLALCSLSSTPFVGSRGPQLRPVAGGGRSVVT